MKQKKNNIYLILLLFAILPYNYSALLLNNFTTVINAFVYIIRIFLLVYVVLYFKNLKLSSSEKKAFIMISIYFIFIFLLNIVSSLITNHTTINDIIVRSFSMLYMYGFYIYMIYNYKNFCTFNTILKKVLILLMFFSIFLYYYYPSIGRFYEGYNVYTLVGIAANRNSYYGLIVPLIVSIFMLQNGKRISFVDKALIFLVIITVFMTKSITSIISLLVFFIIILLCKSTKINVFRYVRYFLIIIWILDLIFIGFNVDLGKISSSFANKSTTMSGRTIIWQKTMHFFKESPLIGYGYDNNIIGNVDNYYLQGNNKFPNDPHNSILFVLLASGILGVSALLLIILKVLKLGEFVCKHDNKYIYIFAYIASLLVRGLTESCIHYPHMIFFVYMIYTYIRYYDIKKECLNEK